MMMAARILRPSREGWKLLVRALKHRWLSMAIWSWKVLPVSGSCGDRGHVRATTSQRGRGRFTGGSLKANSTQTGVSGTPQRGTRAAVLSPAVLLGPGRAGAR